MSYGSRPTVLIVDDDPEVRQLYTHYLDADYDVRTADSGRAALDTIDDDVDIVLLDRRMLELSGDDVLERIRADGYDCPVAMVTAVEPDFDIMAMGFDDYCVKPVSAAELRDLVQSLVLRREYDEVIREYFALVSKVTALEMEKTKAELDANEDYSDHAAQVELIKDQARSALNAAIESGKFDALFRDLAAESDEESSSSDR